MHKLLNQLKQMFDQRKLIFKTANTNVSNNVNKFLD
jgi:hypothetical protein